MLLEAKSAGPQIEQDIAVILAVRNSCGRPANGLATRFDEMEGCRAERRLVEAGGESVPLGAIDVDLEK